MVSEYDVDFNVGLALDVNHLAAVLRRLPSLGRHILTVRVECLDVNVLDSWPDIRESPCHALVMSDDHIWHAGQCYAGGVEFDAIATKVRFVPKIGHLVPEMHVVREQGLSRDR